MSGTSVVDTCVWDSELRAYLTQGYGGDLQIFGSPTSIRIETPTGIVVEAPTIWEALVKFALDKRLRAENAEVRAAMHKLHDVMRGVPVFDEPTVPPKEKDAA